jgi:hypothetical protein
MTTGPRHTATSRILHPGATLIAGYSISLADCQLIVFKLSTHCCLKWIIEQPRTRKVKKFAKTNRPLHFSIFFKKIGKPAAHSSHQHAISARSTDFSKSVVRRLSFHEYKRLFLIAHLFAVE